jgi:integrase
MFEVAREEWGLPIRDNPVRGLKVGRVDPQRERRLRDGELDRLLTAERKCRNPLIGPIVRLAIETAMRRSEILSVTAEAIDLKNRCLVIGRTKNGETRTIPLSTAAMDIFQTRLGGKAQGRLFPMTANALRLAWERLRERAKMTDLHFHDLRHEAISRLFEKGLTVPEVAMISGHRDMRMLLRYAHAIRERVLEKLEKAA